MSHYAKLKFAVCLQISTLRILLKNASQADSGFDNPSADFVLVGTIAILFAVNPKIVKLRKDRDSNPGNLSVLRFSRPPQSTTLSPFQRVFYLPREVGGASL